MEAQHNGDHLTGHQASALAAFRRAASSGHLPSAGSSDSLNAGAEIAAIMQRPPAADPTMDPPPPSANQGQQLGQQLGSSYAQHSQMQPLQRQDAEMQVRPHRSCLALLAPGRSPA